MAGESEQERTEAATPRRLEEARKKGQVARSRELSTLTSLLGSAIGLLVFGPGILEAMRELLTASLGFEYANVLNQGDIDVALGTAIQKALFAIMPLMLMLAGLALFSPIAVGGWIFSADLIMPKFERIDPLKGLMRILSLRALVELGKALGKFILVTLVIVLTLRLVLDDIVALAGFELDFALGQSAELLVWCFLAFSSTLILIAAVDVPWQIWQQRQQLMMTKQELKEEAKESEGRPEVKMAIRQKQHEIAQRRMMDDVKKADVIITNPTHYAVALAYDKAGSRAPQVVAKGKDLIAARIRELASEHKIAIFSAPPLARALYFSTELNQEIPEKLFIAVAQVLAYVYQLKTALTNHMPPPAMPTALPVPPEMDKGREVQ